MLPESSSQPLPATLAQSRNLAHASLETAVFCSMQFMKDNATLVERDLMITFANFAGLQGCLGGGVQAGPQECPRAE